MSWSHGTYGWEQYESFVQALSVQGVSCAEELKDEVFTRGWDGSCACFCGYQIGGLDISRIARDFHSACCSEQRVRELFEANPDLVSIYQAQGYQEGCPCCTGLCDHRQALRIARFTNSAGKRIVVEEYLAVKDLDCDGASQVAIAVYEEGNRPDLATQVLEAL